MSLRLKIALISTLISGSILIGFGVASWYVIYRQRVAVVDREIRTLSSRHPGWMGNRGNYERLASVLEFTFGEDRKQDVLLLVRDAAGSTLFQSPHWPKDLELAQLDLQLEDAPRDSLSSTNGPPDPVTDAPVAPSGPGGGFGPGFGGMGRGFGWGRGGGGPVIFTKEPKFQSVKAGGTVWRLGVLGNNETTLVMGINYAETQRELNQLRNMFLLTLPLALGLVALGGWIVGGRALRPLQSIAETAEHVTARGLDQRIPLQETDPEMARVIRVLNGMMDRLEASFHQATRFTADASHELKTPLTIMQGELERALTLSSPGSREQEVFSNLLEETQRLKSITRTLLLLAQADSGQLKLAREQVNLSELVEALVEDARILGGEQELAIEVETEPKLMVEGDRHLLGTALLNLFTNAVRYNEANGRIAVHLHRVASQIQLSVSNSGPGIPAADQGRVFERFFRARSLSGPAREGVGLGLSLAREIIRAHGGELALKESRAGWTVFAVDLGAAA
jgi:two-component system, OmpR family, heavy metal sensor histidine kinase CusS